jgi:predicted DNA-binding transcriptional regulator AlpA
MAVETQAQEQRDDVLLDQDSSSALLGVSPRTLERWRAERTGPPFVRLSARAIRYSRVALRRWLSENTVECAASRLLKVTGESTIGANLRSLEGFLSAPQ